MFSKVALACGCSALLKAPFPHRLGTKKLVALEWAKVKKLRLEREVARASAQSISCTSVIRDRFCSCEKIIFATGERGAKTVKACTVVTCKEIAVKRLHKEDLRHIRRENRKPEKLVRHQPSQEQEKFTLGQLCSRFSRTGRATSRGIEHHLGDHQRRHRTVKQGPRLHRFEDKYREEGTSEVRAFGVWSGEYRARVAAFYLCKPPSMGFRTGDGQLDCGQDSEPPYALGGDAGKSSRLATAGPM